MIVVITVMLIIQSVIISVVDVQTSLTVNKNSQFTLDASGTQDNSSLTGIMTFNWDDTRCF